MLHRSEEHACIDYDVAEFCFSSGSRLSLPELFLQIFL